MTLALVLASLSLFLAAQLFPLLTLRLHGTAQETSVLASIDLLVRTGWPWLAAVLIVTVELAPSAYLCGLVFVLVRLKQGRGNRGTARVFRIIQDVQGWAMVDVFLLGVLVSYVKLAKLAVVVPGGAMYALAGSALLLAWAVDSMDCQSMWKAMGEKPDALSRAPFLTARKASLIACEACGALAPLEHGNAPCARCAAGLHSRKPDSIRRTWALLATAALLYLPANLLPVMRTTVLGATHSDTILSGIVYFLKTGSWPLALLIFFASVVVPLAKMGLLSFLLLSVEACSRRQPRLRTRLYRLTEFIGRWSMVDLFVVTLMVAMVQRETLASVEPGPAALPFAMVVAATMLASYSFDPRLIWDAMEPVPTPSHPLVAAADAGPGTGSLELHHG
jgi:paraquat-inducible protein A